MRSANYASWSFAMKTQFKLDRQWSCVESAEEEENEVVIHDSIQNEETISNVNVEELYKYIQTKKTVEKDVEIDVVSSTPLRRNNRLANKQKAVYCGENVSNYSDPISISEALSWNNAMNEEINSLRENDTWEVIDKPACANIIKMKWVFKIKKVPNNKLLYRARMVVRLYPEERPRLSGNIFSNS